MARAIDALFDDADIRTLTQSERAANTELLGSIRAVLRTLNIASLAALAILTLILANTIAMNARERTAEYAVLRVLGFGPGHVRSLIVGEALLVAVAATLVGLGIAVPLVNVASVRSSRGTWANSAGVSSHVGNHGRDDRLDAHSRHSAAFVPAVRSGKVTRRKRFVAHREIQRHLPLPARKIGSMFASRQSRRRSERGRSL